MAKLKEIVGDPNYNASAMSASKATIFVFVATFGYLALFSGISPGFIGGAAFFFIGIFVVSIVISMPLFFIRAKAPRWGAIFSVADIVLTIFLTRAVYFWLFTPAVLAGNPFVVTCKEPIPEFTLGINSNPSEQQVQQLCSCIWSKLGTWEKQTSQAFVEGRESDVSYLYKRGFPARFGSAVKECGGMKM
jgi:hypothetical protein